MPNCNSCCPTNCDTCNLITNILIKPKTCEGVFTFGPDSLTCPTSGNTGPNTAICPLDVNVLTNCKGDLKLSLLDDNGCNLDCLLLKCSQYDVSSVVSLVPNGVTGLFQVPGYTDIVVINANNLNLVGQYVAFEEAAYFYREVTQTYLNLWCGAEKNGLICTIIENVTGIINNLSATSPVKNVGQAQQVFNLSQDLLKARVLALKQLCECGKICNDQFFPIQTGPCAALKGCCPQRH